MRSTFWLTPLQSVVVRCHATLPASLEELDCRTCGKSWRTHTNQLDTTHLECVQLWHNRDVKAVKMTTYHRSSYLLHSYTPYTLWGGHTLTHSQRSRFRAGHASNFEQTLKQGAAIMWQHAQSKRDISCPLTFQVQTAGWCLNNTQMLTVLPTCSLVGIVGTSVAPIPEAITCRDSLTEPSTPAPITID